MPKMYIISGCNGSGKTTASYTMLPEMFQCADFVNSDEFAKGLSPFDPDRASIEASRYMLLKIRYMMDRGKDFTVENLTKLLTDNYEVEEERAAADAAAIAAKWIEAGIVSE
jgi:predicted ABC-type ATPase